MRDAGGPERPEQLVVEPIGVFRTPYRELAVTPRQPRQGEGVRGTIELYPRRGFEHALEDLDTWELVWVLFWFHRSSGWRPKVLPPRSAKRRGVFATRSPHRPNPIGLSVIRLESIDGLTLRVRNVDVLDGTPVLDIKPYVPSVDAIADAGSGWLAGDPAPGFDVAFEEPAQTKLAFLSERFGVALRERLAAALALGPAPHPYRRIQRNDDGTLRIAIKAWRARFDVDATARRVRVLDVWSGYRSREIFGGVAPDTEIAPHRALVEHFGPSPSGS